MDLTERPGSSASPYRIESRLGGGGGSEVHAAWDEQLRRRVALKRVRPDLAGDAEIRARFRRAAAAAAVLDHPAIVRIHTLIQAADGGDLLIMELIEGETLAERLRRGPLPVAAAARLAAEIAAALAAAHARRIAHWHLADTDVMITPSGHAKLVGFGAASGWPPAPPVLSLSPGCPPALLELPPDAISDLFALGRILGEMLGGGGGGGERPGSAPPAALSGLVAELRREPAAPCPVDPATVARVAEDLRAIADRLDAAAPSPDRAAEPRAGGAVRRSSRAWARLPVRHRRAMIGALALAAAAAAAAVALTVLRQTGRLGGGPPPLVVVVPRAVLVDTAAGTSGGARELLALALRTALLHAASNLDGVFAWPAELVDAAASAATAAGGEGEPRGVRAADAVRTARRLGAGEALAARLSCLEDTCQVTLSRVAAADGRLLWTESLEAAIGEPYLLAKAAERYAAAAFPGHRRRTGAMGLEVRPQDFAAYLVVLRDLEPATAGGRLTSAAALARLAPVRAGSPRFVEGTLLAAEHAGGTPGTAAALELLRQARLLAPADSRPLCAELAAALAAGQMPRARAALNGLARIEPGAAALLERRLPPAQLRALGGAGAPARRRR